MNLKILVWLLSLLTFAKCTEYIFRLRSIASSSTTDEYEQNLDSFKTSDLVKENEQFEAYVMRKWIPHHKVKKLMIRFLSHGTDAYLHVNLITL